MSTTMERPVTVPAVLAPSEMPGVRDRLLSRVAAGTYGCWIWAGARTRGGYGHLYVDGHYRRAHRVAYEMFVGPIPNGLELDHVCHSRAVDCEGGEACLHRRCVNPDHLEPVDRHLNNRRSRSRSAKNLVKTHCPQGHPYDDENTYRHGNKRACRTCRAANRVKVRESRRFSRCPSWCTQDPDWHHSAGDACHDSEFVILPAGYTPCTRHDESAQDRAETVWLALEREDGRGPRGRTHVYLAPSSSKPGICEEAHLSLDAAEDLAAELLRLVALARGSRRAADLRLGDVVVIGGVAQTVTAINHDSLCCLNRQTGVHECAGSLVVETDVSGDCEAAATYELDDLVPVRIADPDGSDH